MAEVASAYVSLIPSAKGFGKGISAQISGDVDRASKSSGKRGGQLFARSYMGPLKAIGGLAVGLFAAGKVKDFFKSANAEARESQKVGALTASVIKATGGAAKVSAKQVGALAGALSAKTGIDDEVIQSGANMLLTFKNIRNEAGKGNDVFDQSTKTLVDLAAAMGTDPKQAAIQLGKALNDPVKGITALTRVGVTFTEGQKKQITAMVKAGDTLGAQKVILKELNSEFGGAAEAQATAGDKLSVVWGNFKETIGTALLPIIDRLANWLADKLPKALAKAQEVGTRLTTWWKNDLSPALKKAGDVIIPLVRDGIKQITGEFGSGHVTWKQVGDLLTQKLIPAFTTIATVVIPLVVNQTRLGIRIFKDLWAAGKVLATILVASFKVISSVFFTVVGAIINGAAQAFGWVPGLGPKLKTAADKFNDFRDTVNEALDGTQSYKRVYVSAPGASAVVQHLADIRWQIDHIPRSVTIGVNNKLSQMPARAMGGPVRAGQPYIVGEKRPEVFVPDRNGTILPRVPDQASRADRFDYDRMAEAMSRVNLSVPVSSVDRAVVGRLR